MANPKIAETLTTLAVDVRQSEAHTVFDKIARNALVELLSALADAFASKRNTDQYCIEAVRRSLTAWEKSLNTAAAANQVPMPQLVFHRYLIRFSKGIVKQWRILRIDTEKREN